MSRVLMPSAVPVPEKPMTEPRSETAERMRSEEVLTLSEAASLLRVEEAALAKLARFDKLPAQEIGKEWRFHKGALLQWLYYGPWFKDVVGHVPPFWHAEPIISEKVLALLEQRLLEKLALQSPPKPGSKQAVLRHAGAFAGDGDIDQVLAALSEMRKADAGEGGE
jgi:excisionase family DNA binding protein